MVVDCNNVLTAVQCKSQGCKWTEKGCFFVGVQHPEALIFTAIAMLITVPTAVYMQNTQQTLGAIAFWYLIMILVFAAATATGVGQYQ